MTQTTRKITLDLLKSLPVDAFGYIKAGFHEEWGSSCLRWRVNGKLGETAIVGPDRRARLSGNWWLPIKHGLRTTGRMTKDNASCFHLDVECPDLKERL